MLVLYQKKNYSLLSTTYKNKQKILKPTGFHGKQFRFPNKKSFFNASANFWWIFLVLNFSSLFHFKISKLEQRSIVKSYLFFRISIRKFFNNFKRKISNNEFISENQFEIKHTSTIKDRILYISSLAMFVKIIAR